ncbi:hypothetical protein BST61_g1542 [Cercospora zeina]
MQFKTASVIALGFASNILAAPVSGDALVAREQQAEQTTNDALHLAGEAYAAHENGREDPYGPTYSGPNAPYGGNPSNSPYNAYGPYQNGPHQNGPHQNGPPQNGAYGQPGHVGDTLIARDAQAEQTTNDFMDDGTRAAGEAHAGHDDGANFQGANAPHGGTPFDADGPYENGPHGNGPHETGLHDNGPYENGPHGPGNDEFAPAHPGSAPVRPVGPPPAPPVPFKN